MIIEVKENEWINTSQIIKMKLTKCTDNSFNLIITQTGKCQVGLSFPTKHEALHLIRRMGGVPV